jgi:hypothetical protein
MHRHTHTHRQQRDLISLLSFFQNKGSGLNVTTERIRVSFKMIRVAVVYGLRSTWKLRWLTSRNALAGEFIKNLL